MNMNMNMSVESSRCLLDVHQLRVTDDKEEPTAALWHRWQVVEPSDVGRRWC
eukprot:m.429579 g.429579  ORF g.429579 m.429579 type:complete len:52 (+) comp75122_c0_seq1:113-268(+)